jgi:hypothetical protein
VTRISSPRANALYRFPSQVRDFAGKDHRAR